MEISLSADELAFQKYLQDFFATQIPAEIRERTRDGVAVMPDDLVTVMRILNAEGICVPRWPIKFGGKDWTPVQQHIWQSELNLAHVPEPLAFNAAMVGPVIATFGSEELKKRFLSATANCEIWWSQGFSEPESGSDLASLKTRAVKDGTDYVVNGQKTWTTLGQYGDWIFTLVRTDPDAKPQAGISFLLIDMRSPGVTVRPIELIDGGHEVNEVFFDNVRVPQENLVGEENMGWTYAKFLLGNERMMVARVAYSKDLLSRAKTRAQEIRCGETTLLDDPYLSARFAELENDLLALEVTQLRMVASSADGKPNPASSMLKLRGSELQQAVTELMNDIAGSDSLPINAPDIETPTWTQTSAKNFLNYRKVTIYGGSSEVQRSIIASANLGL